MKKNILTIDDFSPRESTFVLTSAPDAPITLTPFSLRVRSWAMATFGADKLKDIFEKQKIEEIAKIAFFMLKDKTRFKSFDDFQEAILTPRDHLALITAVLGSVGISEPKLEEIRKAIEPKKDAGEKKPDPKQERPKSKKNSIGAKSSTK